MIHKVTINNPFNVILNLAGLFLAIYWFGLWAIVPCFLCAVKVDFK